VPLLLLTLILVVLAWLVSRAVRTAGQRPRLDEQLGHELVETLFRDGVRLGYRRAWVHQLVAEEQRVRAFVRRRTLTTLAAASGGLLTAALPLGAALGVLPHQSAWLPAWPQWQWLLLALLVGALCLGIGVLLMPRDYKRFSGSRQATQVELGRLNEEISGLVGTEAAENLNAMKAFVAALAKDQFAAGVKHAEGQGTAGMQTRISSAANAAYVQGRSDGAVEARAEVSQLTTEAYLRGVGDGERTALSKLEARIRAEREAAYQSGYKVGLSEGRTAAARAAQAGPAPSGPTSVRPRTRSDALAIFELSAGALPDDIRKRYRELQTALHPDGLKGRKAPTVLVRFAEEQFKLVGEAYAILQPD